MADAGKSGILTWKKYGDWLEPGRVPSEDIIGEMSSAFNFGQTLRIARDTATALGESQDAVVFATRYAKIQRLYHSRYWNSSIDTYGNGQQAALVYALYLGAVPASSVPKIFAKLLALIEMPRHRHRSRC